MGVLVKTAAIVLFPTTTGAHIMALNLGQPLSCPGKVQNIVVVRFFLRGFMRSTVSLPGIPLFTQRPPLQPPEINIFHCRWDQAL